jgi:predicted Zn-dependent protease
MNAMHDLENRFDVARKVLFGELTSGEELSIDFMGERSAFMRFNGGKVRQFGEVDVAYASIRLFREGRSIEAFFNLSGDVEADSAVAAKRLSQAREECSLLPEDPYRSPSKASGQSTETFTGSFPPSERLPAEVLAPAAGLDFVGMHSQGSMVRGAANSAGARHWFATETFITDWSAWLPSGKAVKSCYAGRDWDGGEHARRLAEAKARLEPLAGPERKLSPGEYRAYISPDAANELMPFFSWNGLSERSIQEGSSAFLPLREGRKSLSPAFSLAQDFSLGVEPRFNESGEVAPERLLLIDAGKLGASLVSERSAKQYGLPSNAAPDWEGLRSPSISAGKLPQKDALEALGSGVYVSNFHYLNWSDLETARITGMTRFACFWVEGGKIVAPIKDMRFDESLYELLGPKLEALTAERSLIPENGSYFIRALGGALLPGFLVNGLKFTL